MMSMKKKLKKSKNNKKIKKEVMICLENYSTWEEEIQNKSPKRMWFKEGVMMIY
jgi:hypothetical protein